MKIWKFQTDANKFDHFIYKNEDDCSKVLWDYKFEGNRIADRWIPLEVDVFKHKKRSDTPTFSIPVLSKRAVDVYKDLIGDVVEFLPLKYDKGDYFLVNVLDVVDCIDFDKAEFIPFESGRVMMFTKYAFKQDAVQGKHIFKIVELPKTEVFVSDEFKRIIEENKLIGFKLQEVWNSEC
ncbi:MAG: hypothetical protein N2645_15405 [Clostridia bacterium]|nr:hypothetical protein [Clostridia bacterium]